MSGLRALILGIAVILSALAAGSAGAAPDPMTRAQIVENAKSVVGFSYWWGGGAWLPGSASKGKCTPTGSSGCPNCTHSGSYGADCSGFVAKAWQIDKPTPLEKNYHPFSTWHFDTYTTWWTKPAKGEAKQADAFNYNTNGAGHVFMFEKGDPWGSAWAWECKGCSYGCVHNLRTVSSNYGLIRRKLITEPPACKAHCEGSVVVDDNCGKGDCAPYAATCVDDSLGVRCVSAFCPAKGKTQTCLPDPKNGKIATCNNGALQDPGDCGAYGAICSTAVGSAAKCVSSFCATSPTAKPKAGDLCYQGKRYTCTAAGDLSEAPCPAGQPCQTLAGQTGPGSGTCGPKPCGSCDDGNPCTDDSCDDGVCIHAPNTAACDDGNPCTVSDTCAGASCKGAAKDCDDGVACTADSCAGGTCGHEPDAGLCNDGNPCTADTCVSSGCLQAPIDGPCEDGDGCTMGGGCQDGTCQPGIAKMCDDENTCTADACVEGACVHDPLPGKCDDGDGCTHGDYCALGQCLAGQSLLCDDGLACTADSCIDGKCLHLGPGAHQPQVCQGKDIWVPPPCPGLTGRLIICPEAAPCLNGWCTGADGAVVEESDASGDGAGLGGLGDAGGSAAGYAKNTAPASGCQAGQRSSGLTVVWLLGMGAALWVRRRRWSRDESRLS